MLVLDYITDSVHLERRAALPRLPPLATSPPVAARDSLRRPHLLPRPHSTPDANRATHRNSEARGKEQTAAKAGAEGDTAERVREGRA